MDDHALMSHDRCDRCDQYMSSRIMSFFTSEIICMECLRAERELLVALVDNEVDVSRLAGCGYVPADDGSCPQQPEPRRKPSSSTAGMPMPPAAD